MLRAQMRQRTDTRAHSIRGNLQTMEQSNVRIGQSNQMEPATAVM